MRGVALTAVAATLLGYLDSHLIDEYIVADLQNEVSKLQEGFKVEWNAKMRQVIERVREVHAERIMIKPIKHE